MKQPSTEKLCLFLDTHSNLIRSYLASLGNESSFLFAQTVQDQQKKRTHYRHFTATLTASFHKVQGEILTLHKTLLETDKQMDNEGAQNIKKLLDSLTKWESQCLSLLEEIDQKLLEDRDIFPRTLILRNYQGMLQKTAYIASLCKGDHMQ